jgi:hypothetical protein
MKKGTKLFLSLVLTICVLCFTAAGNLSAEWVSDTGFNPVADVNISPSGISFTPRVSYSQLLMTVSGPDGSIFNKTFDTGVTPFLGLSDAGKYLTDGLYTYELRVIPALSQSVRSATASTVGKQNERALVQNGSFTVAGGSIVVAGKKEDLSRPTDVLHYDDVIITGSLCIGFDCANGESFGYCTLKLKENNLQLCFEDTSIGSFPTNDWKIQINDTTSGGASYFTIWDTDGGRRVFTLEAGAPAHSLYVEDYGRVGLGTSIPYVELHIKDGDSPTIRLDQDGSSGWAAQSWDLCGNETNFFIRDVTNGSKLCFRIQPSTPSNTLCMRSSGNVGIGTWSPAYDLEVEDTGDGAQIVADRTDGATMEFSASGSYGIAGTKTNHPVQLRVNDVEIMRINGSGDYLDMIGGGTYDGDWNNGSSRETKENIRELDVDQAMNAFTDLNPVRFFYKQNSKEEHLGFIAEDVPDLVASNSRKNLSTMDVVAVLTKVLQEQQKMVKEQQKTINELKKEINELKKK